MVVVPNEEDVLQIGEFAELEGLSVPQLRRYDRLQLLAPARRSDGDTGTTASARPERRVSSPCCGPWTCPLEDICSILSSAGDEERPAVLQNHRFRLEARLEEVRRLLEVVDAMTEEDHPVPGRGERVAGGRGERRT